MISNKALPKPPKLWRGDERTGSSISVKVLNSTVTRDGKVAE
jgi:hypothetical protein